MTPDELDDIVHMAQALAKNCQWRVFPCRQAIGKPDDKAPTCPNGFKAASRDPQAIAELWRRFPGDLIGVVTGEVFDCLDIDIKHQPAIDWWAAASKRIPPTRSYQTRSGGRHCYFQPAQGLPCSTSKLAKGVDVKASGGYVISWYARGFECLDNTPPAPWPSWLLKCAMWKPEPTSVPAMRRATVHPDNAVEGIVRVVSSAREGERNAVLFWAACRLRERTSTGQIAQGEASTLLIAAARAAGLQDNEAQRTIASAWRAV